MKGWTRVLVALLLLAGCSRSGLSGTYVAQADLGNGKTMEVGRYEFSPSGKVIVTEPLMGSTVELLYEVEGDRLKLRADGSGAAQLFTIDESGSIVGPMGIKLVKKS
jgi:hypothetical protein